MASVLRLCDIMKTTTRSEIDILWAAIPAGAVTSCSTCMTGTWKGETRLQIDYILIKQSLPCKFDRFTMDWRLLTGNGWSLGTFKQMILKLLDMAVFLVVQAPPWEKVFISQEGARHVLARISSTILAKLFLFQKTRNSKVQSSMSPIPGIPQG